MMSSAGSLPKSPECSIANRRPLQLLTGIFSRKNRKGEETEEMLDNMADITDDASDCWSGDRVSMTTHDPTEILRSPFHPRKIDEDMENLRLSRQDNPYLQVLASRECMRGSPAVASKSHHLSKENMGNIMEPDSESLAELHKRLVRSPPPVMWMSNRSSEPSFVSMGRTSDENDFIFKFPPVSTSMIPDQLGLHSDHPRSANSVPSESKFLSPLEYNNGSSRVRDSALEGVAGRFNLSPHLRRRPQKKI